MPNLNTIDSKIWPEGVQCAVLFSFDVDGETLWLCRNPENWHRPGNLAQGSYGPRFGVPKILRVLEKHGIKSTFFIPGWIIEKYPDMAREVLRQGHEVAYHGYLHESDPKAGYEKEREVMKRTFDIFDRILKIKPSGIRAPMAEVTEGTIRLMHEHEFLYSSTMMDNDYPYFWTYQGKPSKIVELPIQWMWDDSSYFFFTLSEPVRRGISACSTVYEIWTEEFDGIYENEALFSPLFHPQISGRFSRIKLIDNLLTYMKGRKGTWITTGEEIARFWQNKQS